MTTTLEVRHLNGKRIQVNPKDEKVYERLASSFDIIAEDGEPIKSFERWQKIRKGYVTVVKKRKCSLRVPREKNIGRYGHRCLHKDPLHSLVLMIQWCAQHMDPPTKRGDPYTSTMKFEAGALKGKLALIEHVDDQPDPISLWIIVETPSGRVPKFEVKLVIARELLSKQTPPSNLAEYIDQALKIFSEKSFALNAYESNGHGADRIKVQELEIDDRKNLKGNVAALATALNDAMGDENGLDVRVDRHRRKAVLVDKHALLLARARKHSKREAKKSKTKSA